MRILAYYDPPPIPVRNMDWRAIDVDAYDGAPDSKTRSQIGYGGSRQQAINELMDLLEEDHPVRCANCSALNQFPEDRK
jgi:hypothetical protein